MPMVKMGDVCTWAKGCPIPRDHTDVGKEIPYLHYGDLYKKYDYKVNLDEQADSIIKVDSITKLKESQYLHDGDIVFALTSETVDDLGHCTLVINPSEHSFIAGMETTVVHIIDKVHVLPAYLNYYFHSSLFQKTLRQYVTGMKVYRVHPDDLMKIEVNLPNYENQVKIVSILDSISDEIDIIIRINDNLGGVACVS